jgi:hypothetical protein
MTQTAVNCLDRNSLSSASNAATRASIRLNESEVDFNLWAVKRPRNSKNEA